MRCPECNKFVSLDTQEPDESSTPTIANNNDGTCVFTAEYTIDRNCADCSTLLKQGEVGVEELLNLSEDDFHAGHSLSATAVEVEATESGGGRYKRNMIGVGITGTVHCDTCDEDVCDFNAGGEIAASSFEEQV